MGSNVFEDICAQWLRRYAGERLGLTLESLGRYWSRDGSTEIDIIGEVNSGTFLFGECKWRESSTMRLSDYIRLRAKVANLPNAHWKQEPTYVLFALGGFGSELEKLAADTSERLYLVSGSDLLPRFEHRGA